MRISCLCIILCEEDNSGVDAREEPVTKVSRRLLLHSVVIIIMIMMVMLIMMMIMVINPRIKQI